MQFIVSSVIILILALGVESACDFDIIIKINSLWGDNAPVGVLDKLVGSMTYLYIPHLLKNDTPGFKCIKTVLEETDKTAEDYHLYEGDAKVVKYQMRENKVNITRSFYSDGSSSDDYVFPVYLKNSVFGFWQCRGDYESFINIGVLNYLSRQEEVEVREAIAEAETELRMLGLEFPPSRGNC